MTVTLLHGDCLEHMKTIPDGSVDLILNDPPYGSTSNKWDTIIPFEPMWEQLRRILKNNGTAVFTASQPFTTSLIMSNIEWFKYCLVWEKTRATGHVHAKNKPMKKHEDILIFSSGTTVHASQSVNRMTYNPQGLEKMKNIKIRKAGGESNTVMSVRPSHRDVVQEYENYPTSIIKIASEGATIHPTQKPVALMEYLVKTYTNENETVLDFTMGSGTTGVACVNTNRNFIGIELDDVYYNLAKDRIEKAEKPLLPPELFE